MGRSEVVLVAVGDVHPDRPEPETLFDLVAAEIRSGDLAFCALECLLSEKGVLRQDKANPIHRVAPSNVRSLESAGFNVVSFAGNNALDYGPEAFLDTIDLLRNHQMAVVGVGKNLRQARSPVVVNVNGTRIAFVSHCSILPKGYDATDKRPGVAPLKVRTFYEPLENIYYEQPGTPCRTITVPDPDDLEAVIASVREARGLADVVVASFHWGVHWVYDLATYLPEVAYAAIDAGADLVLGHHPHCLQAIDVYKGKAIFYSLGNFAFETTNPARDASASLSAYGFVGERTKSVYHPPHTRQCIMAKCLIVGGRVEGVTFQPSIMGNREKPELLKSNDPRFTTIFELMSDLSEELGTSLVREEDTIRVALEKKRDCDARKVIRQRKISYPHLRRLPYVQDH